MRHLVSRLAFREIYTRYPDVHHCAHPCSDPAALGAVPIPRVRGKWPGNLDIVLGFIQSLHDDYPMQFMDDLFEQYGCKTLNLRMLWEDQVRTHIRPTFDVTSYLSTDMDDR